MRRLALAAMIMIPAALFVAACGDDEEGSTSSFIEACEEYCEASFAVDCGLGLTVDQCKAGCPTYAEQQRGLCLSEQEAVFRCAAPLEFKCMGEVSVPDAAACASEGQAFTVCQQEAPCKSFCAAAVKAGCGGASEEACVASCKQDLMEIGFCSNDQNRLLACQGDEGVTCENGAPRSAACTEEALDLADCAGFDDPCLGHCIAAEVAGCGGDSREACAADCQSKLGSLPNCQFDYENLLRCDANEGVTCDGSTAKSSAECSFEQQDFDACAAGGM